MSSKIIFTLASLCVVNASVITINVIDDNPETEVVHQQQDCNFQACDQLCRRLGFPGGACVNGRCNCDNFHNAEVTGIEESLSDPAESIPQRDCNYRECDQRCRRLGFPGGACVNGRCKCDNFRSAEGAVSETSESHPETAESLSLRSCDNRNCDQTCRRQGFTGGICVNGRCKCDINLDGGVSQTVSETAESLFPRSCDNRNCDQTCRRLGFTGGICVNGRCKCDINLDGVSHDTAESVTRTDCYFRECEQLCRRLGFTGDACVNGRCQCDNFRDTEESKLINGATTLENEESNLILKTDEGEMNVPSRNVCNTIACNDMCHRLNYAGGMCRQGVCQCY